jgi:integrating conjugative element protein (TIGR03746 family)
MASGYVNALETQKAINRILFTICLGLAGLCALAMWGWHRAPRDLTLHVPPDLRSGARIKPRDVPLPNVYTFAFYVWQQINRWAQDGDKDYGLAIFKMASYITPACRHKLEADMNRKANAGELALRVRALMEMPGHGYAEARVMPTGNGTWLVSLDTEIAETVRGVPVKSAFVRYPLRVIQFDGDREANPWGLAIDCWPDHETPTRIDIKAQLKGAPDAQHARSLGAGGSGERQNMLANR